MNRRSAVTWLAGLVLARAAVFVAFGADFVGDDRGFVARGVLGGVRSIGTDFREGRPGAGLVYDVVYGLAGQRPLALFALVTLLNLAVVVALFLVLARFVSVGSAFLVSAAWVITANHTSLTVWGATTPTLVALFLLLLGILATIDRRWLASAALLAGAILCYELVAPFAAVTLALALHRDRRDLRSLFLLPVAVLAVGAATAWSKAHSIYPVDWRLPDPLLLWLGHFGTALVGGPDAPGIVEVGLAFVITLGALGAAVAWLRGERGREDGPWLVVTGVVVIALGLLVTLTIPTTSHGTSDRLYAASSIGAAMVLVGTVVWAMRRVRMGPVVTLAAIGLVGLCAVGQVVALRAWSDAGADGAAAIDRLGERAPHPEDVDWVIGPSLLTRDGVIVLQSWDADHALRLAYGPGRGSVRVAARADEFRATTPEERLVTWGELLGRDGG